MTRTLPRLSWSFALCLLLPSAPLLAEETPLRNLLRDALYTEEVSRDPDKAAQQYEELLSKLDEQRTFAATALFRLAEVRRKQGRKEEAIQLYQRLIREFPAAGPELKLATENLGTLGAKIPETGNPVSDDETKELLRLQALASTGPDRLRDPANMVGAAQKGWLKVIHFLIEQGQDPYKTEALYAATFNGYLNVCKALLDAKGTPPPEIADEALKAAVGEKRREILKLYVKAGFDLNRPLVLPQSLQVSPAAWDRGITDLLISAGADLDIMPARTWPPSTDRGSKSATGTPLHEAISYGNVAAANELLDRGCKPDPGTPADNISPLHIAANSEEKEMSPVVKRLLAAGADPNRETTFDRDGGALMEWSKTTPLELALRANNKDSIQHLLAAGAQANRPRVLERALASGDLSLLTSLFDAGLDPAAHLLPHDRNIQDGTVFGHLATRTDLDPRVLDVLAGRGARPSQAWIESRFRGATAQMSRLLNRKFIYSSLAIEPAITAIFGGTSPSELARQHGGSDAPSFASLYDKIHEKTSGAPNNTRIVPTTATIVRRLEDGGFQEIPIDVSNDAPLPALRWGDVIEFPAPAYQQAGTDSYGSNEIYWMYRSKLEAALTVEIGGSEKSYVLDGKRLVFDVTSDRLPWSTANQAADLLWPTPLSGNESSSSGMVISVARKDWPLLRLDRDSDAAENFQLQAGDKIKLEIPEPARTAIAETRKKGVTVRAPGHPYLVYFSSISNPNDPGNQLPSDPMIPTLSQLLAEIYGGAAAIEPSYFSYGEASALGAISTNVFKHWRKFAVLPFPDFSAIRILRLKEDGTDEEISVDWSKAIEAVSDSSEAAEAKKTDLFLKAGDIVELRVRKDRPAGEWKGFSPKEELLLAKMMQGQIQFENNSGVSLQQLNYKAPLYRETLAGWLPTIPPGGTPSMKIPSVQQRDNTGGPELISLKRGDINHTSLPRRNVFLRDGDVLIYSSSAYPQPGQQALPARQRVVPPTR